MIPLHQRHSKWQSVGRYHFGDLVPQPMDELVTKTCITNVTMETLNSQEHRSRGTNAVPRVIHLIFQTIIEVIRRYPLLVFLIHVLMRMFQCLAYCVLQ
ncbi:uncharacterized protein [Panulirus ornatus]|uniref:uncharacterized protein isoform X5 n=1 Tax=Panulirus ornatus TaxID=150431 RepID=UPI003A8402B5